MPAVLKALFWLVAVELDAADAAHQRAGDFAGELLAARMARIPAFDATASRYSSNCAAVSLGRIWCHAAANWARASAKVRRCHGGACRKASRDRSRNSSPIGAPGSERRRGHRSSRPAPRHNGLTRLPSSCPCTRRRVSCIRPLFGRFARRANYQSLGDPPIRATARPGCRKEVDRSAFDHALQVGCIRRRSDSGQFRLRPAFVSFACPQTTLCAGPCRP